jgi:DNA-binding YbaB/EbfC family protein
MKIEDLLSGGGLEGLLGQARQMQTQLAEAQARAGRKQVTGESGGGLVRVTVTGRLDVTSVVIDPVVVQDVDMLQDLIVAATNDAMRRAREMVEHELGPLAAMAKAAGLGGFGGG